MPGVDKRCVLSRSGKQGSCDGLAALKKELRRRRVLQKAKEKALQDKAKAAQPVNHNPNVVVVGVVLGIRVAKRRR